MIGIREACSVLSNLGTLTVEYSSNQIKSAFSAALSFFGGEYAVSLFNLTLHC